jgi:hypothetical protein
MFNLLSSALLLCILLISGCQTISNQPLPQWVTSPQFSEEKFYAIGEGVSLKEAQANAKEALAAQLLSHVSSELDVLSIHDGEFNRQYIEKRTQAHFNKIALPAIKIPKQQKVGYHYYAQATLDKAQLKSFLDDSLIQQKAKAQTLLKESKRLSHPFDRWWFLTQHQAEVNHISDQILIFNSLFSPKKKKIRKIAQQLFTLKNNARQSLTLNISDQTPIKGLKAEIEKQLTRNKISQDDSWFGSKPTIRLQVSEQTESRFNEYYCHARLTITLLSKKGQVLSSHSINTRAVSVSSTSDAKTKSHRALLKQLKKVDIIKTLQSA